MGARKTAADSGNLLAMAQIHVYRGRMANRDDLHAILCQRAEEWVPRLLPAGHRDRNRWIVGDARGKAPKRKGGGSCQIELRGAKAGLWTDRATGEGGGPVQLIGAVTGLIGTDLIRRAHEIVGLEFRAAPTPRRSGAARRSAVEAALDPRWPDRDDTIVGTYLRSRCPEVPDGILSLLSDIVGRKTDTYYRYSTNNKSGLPKEGATTTCPSITVPIADGQGRIHAFKIYLSDDYKSKANLEYAGIDYPSKKRLTVPKNRPSTAGMYYRIGQAAPLALVCEGLETGIAIAAAMAAEVIGAEACVMVAVDAPGMRYWRPPPGTARVVAVGDRDEHATSLQAGAGEQAARVLLMQLTLTGGIDLSLVLPGGAGSSTDFLDLYNRDPVAARRLLLEAPDHRPGETEIQTQEARRKWPGWIAKNVAVIAEIDKRGEVSMMAQGMDASTAIAMEARLLDADGRDIGRRVRVDDIFGEHIVDILFSSLMSANPEGARLKLKQAGLRVSPKFGWPAMLGLIAESRPSDTVVMIDRPGPATVAGTAIFACPDGEIVWADPAAETPTELTDAGDCRAGDLAGWRAAIAALTCDKMPLHWRMAPLIGLSGIIAAAARRDPLGYVFVGRTSTGKTVGAAIANSVWRTGDRTLLPTALSTVNALEAGAEAANGTLMVLDELAFVPPKEIGLFIHAIASGIGKERLNRSGDPRPRRRWSVPFLMTGEAHPRAIAANAGGIWRGGMEARICAVNTSAAPTVAAETLGAGLAALRNNYGHAGPALVRHLAAQGLLGDPERLGTLIDAARKRLMDMTADRSEAIDRITAGLAAAIVAGDLAVEAEILPAATVPLNIVGHVWSQWLDSDAADTLDRGQSLIDRLQEAIAARIDKDILAANLVQKVTFSTIGWYEPVSPGVKPKDFGLYLTKTGMDRILPEVDKQTKIKALEEAGLIAKQGDRYLHRGTPRFSNLNTYRLSSSFCPEKQADAQDKAEAYPC